MVNLLLSFILETKFYLLLLLLFALGFQKGIYLPLPDMLPKNTLGLFWVA